MPKDIIRNRLFRQGFGLDKLHYSAFRKNTGEDYIDQKRDKMLVKQLTK